MRAKTPESPRLRSTGNSGKCAPVNSEKWVAKLSGGPGVSKECPADLPRPFSSRQRIRSDGLRRRFPALCAFRPKKDIDDVADELFIGHGFEIVRRKRNPRLEMFGQLREKPDPVSRL